MNIPSIKAAVEKLRGKSHLTPEQVIAREVGEDILAHEAKAEAKAETPKKDGQGSELPPAK